MGSISAPPSPIPHPPSHPNPNLYTYRPIASPAERAAKIPSKSVYLEELLYMLDPGTGPLTWGWGAHDLPFQSFHRQLDDLGSYFPCLALTNKPGLECMPPRCLVKTSQGGIFLNNTPSCQRQYMQLGTTKVSSYLAPSMRVTPPAPLSAPGTSDNLPSHPS
jgi:hypothetical protein